MRTANTNSCSFESEIVSYSRLIYDFSCQTVWGLHCHILHFIMHHTFSMGIRSRLQAGQSSTYTLLLQSQAVVTRAECVSLSCRNKHACSWKRCLDGSISCSKTWMYLSAFMVPSQMCKLAKVQVPQNCSWVGTFHHRYVPQQIISPSKLSGHLADPSHLWHTKAKQWFHFLHIFWLFHWATAAL